METKHAAVCEVALWRSVGEAAAAAAGPGLFVMSCRHEEIIDKVRAYF